MTHSVKSPKKLIEVALPLDIINVACSHEKSIRHGHPSTLHLWWARRPLAAARAVIFSQMVNDPSWKWEMEHPGEIPPSHLKASWAASRKRLFKIIEDLVLWENTTNEVVLERARAEIRKSWREVCELNKEHPQATELFNPEKLPAFHDPFAGGGAIPLEAQRLGLEAYASDLNPVAVLINKAMIEIPPKFAGKPPVHSMEQSQVVEVQGRNLKVLNSSNVQSSALGNFWEGVAGLAEDIRYYGKWMRDEAEKRIGHLYPKVEITAEIVKERSDLDKYVGKKLTIIAWLWTRTVKSPNPAFAMVDVPLASTFMLSTKAGKVAYVEPVIDDRGYRFTVKVGMPQDVETTKRGTKLGSSGSSFYCLMSGTPMPFEYLRQEAKDGRMGARLMAIVAEGDRGRVYLTPTPEMEAVALSANPLDVLETYLPQKALGFRIQEYGMKQWRDLFTPRQLKALTTFSDLVQEAREKVKTDALASGMNDDCQGLDDGGLEATAYADAVSVYLAFAVSKTSNRASTLCTFKITVECPGDTFGRQALSMTWDYAEANIVAGPSGSFESMLANTVAGILSTAALFVMPGVASQADASKQTQSSHKIVSTDPPYYDNIGYADLSDFFYVWLRRSLKPVFPDLFATLAVPKAEELVATAYRHGSKGEAEAFFLDGMTQAMQRLAEQSHPAFPVTIYYAFKQTESDGVNGVSNSGWETFLDAVIRAGFAITGTWPVRTERENRKRNQDSNALASSIVLVCRKRVVDAHTISRREYIRELNAILPEALDEMTKGSGNDVSPVAPVDLSQAIIGPGMAVFTKYASVLEADGSPMTVHTALQLINRFLAEDDFDADTRFCLHWFEQNGWSAGRFGDADTLSRAKGTSVDGVANAGIIESGGGNVRLLKWSEYSSDWDPTTDTRNPIWETLHHLIRSLKQDGETAAGRLLSYVKSQGESVRQLAYRLYTLCERQGWAEDARAYNELITSWSGIESASVVAPSKLTQVGLI